jgi:DNA-binding response OmpR family regulator
MPHAINSRLVDANVNILANEGKSDANNHVNRSELGAAETINKPFNYPELTAWVKSHLQLKRMREKLDKSDKKSRPVEFVHTF